MARYHDVIGYGIESELVDGVWADNNITERAYYGDVLSTTRYYESAEKVNDDLRLTQRLSILADAFAYENFSLIKYAMWMGTAWQVTAVTVDRPRLQLTLGGVYHGLRPT